MSAGAEKESDETTASSKSDVALYLNLRLRSPCNPRFKYSKLLHLNRRLLHLIRGLISPRISGCCTVLKSYTALPGSPRFKCSKPLHLNRRLRYYFCAPSSALTLWPSFPNGNLPPTRIGHSR